MVTGKRIVQAVQNHPYIATGVALGVGVLVCPECDVAEIVVTARRVGFFTRLFQRIFGQACFAAGTLVQTDHGLRPIETIKPGDMVLSRDESTGRTAYKRVTAVKAPTQDELYMVELDVPAEKTVEHHADFQATATHPWRTADGHWVQTTQLLSGMMLLRADGGPARVEWVRDTNRKAPTYNLTVEDFHTYFVGKDHVWVHNACYEFKTDHYAPRLERAGIDVQAAEDAVRDALQAGGPDAGSVSVDGQTLFYRSFKLPNGTPEHRNHSHSLVRSMIDIDPILKAARLILGNAPEGDGKIVLNDLATARFQPMNKRGSIVEAVYSDYARPDQAENPVGPLSSVLDADGCEIDIILYWDRN